jgi:hypothetical protein
MQGRELFFTIHIKKLPPPHQRGRAGVGVQPVVYPHPQPLSRCRERGVFNERGKAGIAGKGIILCSLSLEGEGWGEGALIKTF